MWVCVSARAAQRDLCLEAVQRLYCLGPFPSLNIDIFTRNSGVDLLFIDSNLLHHSLSRLLHPQTTLRSDTDNLLLRAKLFSFDTDKNQH